ncbi:MAG: hypothetical protein J5636_03480 [Clostridiales bacterium]|nr:hypothetical protein [Clostridiales bacterium]
MSESQSNTSSIDLSAVEPYTPTAEQEKTYTSGKIKSAWGLLVGSLLFLLIVVALVLLFIHVLHIIVFSFRIIVGLLIILILPFYGVYNVVSTMKNVSRKNYSFYTGEILGKTDKGYIVKGIQSSGLSFIDKADACGEKAAGAKVIIACMKDEFDLLGLE